jgi:hypothetical protein
VRPPLQAIVILKACRRHHVAIEQHCTRQISTVSTMSGAR